MEVVQAVAPMCIVNARIDAAPYDFAQIARELLLAERRISPSAVVDDAIMNGSRVAILRSYVGACRGHAVRVLRIYPIKKSRLPAVACGAELTSEPLPIIAAKAKRAMREVFMSVIPVRVAGICIMRKRMTGAYGYVRDGRHAAGKFGITV